MKKSYRNRILSILLCAAVFMSFSFTLAFADSAAKKTPAADGNKGVYKEISSDYALQNDPAKAIERAKKNSFILDDEDEDYIQWNGAEDFTLYRGEKLYVNFRMYDTWENYYTIPSFTIFNSDDDDDEYSYVYAPADSDLIVTVDSYDDYDGYFDIDSDEMEEDANYVISLTAMPCYNNGVWPDDYDTFEIPIEFVEFKVKDLAKPTSLKLTAGKKRVTITYKKSTGATKYEIYRSTKKSSGYKKIATTSKTKYIDKKVSKGKRYYYKVRAIRDKGAGKIRTSYTSPKRSAKVK